MNQPHQNLPEHEPAPRFIALFPLLIFVVFYLGLSLWANDFYKVPMPIAFLVASAAVMLLKHRTPLMEKVEIYARGMGESNIMLMCLIFILAGAFASVSKGMGAVDAAVLLTRKAIPPAFMLSGLFLISCAISLSIGTSCGTIAALMPIACGLIGPLNIQPELMLGAVIGGAMFGDNLSMISDTTIAATRTQNVAMRDKFIVNVRMVLPAAIICVIVYVIFGRTQAVAAAPLAAVTWLEIVRILPYLFILVFALCGVNVMLLLFFGVLFSCSIGIVTARFDLWKSFALCWEGILGMSETLIVAILAGGLLKMIRWNGGIAYLMEKITRAVHSRRGCEFGIFLLAGCINLFTANNTVAIVIAGPLAQELSARFHCDPRRIAGILDTATCFVQGIIPYGAQLLIAVGIAKASGLSVAALSLMGKLYYPWLMGISLVLMILFRPERRDGKA